MSVIAPSFGVVALPAAANATDGRAPRRLDAARRWRTRRRQGPVFGMQKPVNVLHCAPWMQSTSEF
jgi:hypothetical protein